MSVSPMKKRLYVGSLSYDADDDQVEELFQSFGELAFIKVQKDASGVPKRVAYLEYVVPSITDLGIQVFKGMEFGSQFFVVRYASDSDKPSISSV